MTSREEGERKEHGPYAALLVDYGGVLTTSMTASFAQFCLATGVHPERLRLVLAAAYGGEIGEDVTRDGLEDLVPALETGRMTLEAFNDRLAAVLSEGLDLPIEAGDLTTRLFGAADSDHRMIEAVRSARSHGVRTALVSNTWGIQDPPSWYDEVFDAVVLSGREGVRKPEPEIFRLTARRLGVRPEACVFVDDIAVNVEGARTVGMAGVLHRHPDITIPRLEELLGVGLA